MELTLGKQPGIFQEQDSPKGMVDPCWPPSRKLEIGFFFTRPKGALPPEGKVPLSAANSCWRLKRHLITESKDSCKCFFLGRVCQSTANHHQASRTIIKNPGEPSPGTRMAPRTLAGPRASDLDYILQTIPSPKMQLVQGSIRPSKIDSKELPHQSGCPLMRKLIQGSFSQWLPCLCESPPDLP